MFTIKNVTIAIDSITEVKEKTMKKKYVFLNAILDKKQIKSIKQQNIVYGKGIANLPFYGKY
jgi:hypothetical protein